MLKKILFLAFSIPFHVFAQSSMIINYKNGDIKTICIDDIDYISFREDNQENPINKNRSSVLIENFIAQNCVNSPNSELFIDEFIANHEDDTHHYIVVNLFGGPLSLSCDKSPYGLGNNYADFYNEYLNVLSWPATFVNRYSFENSSIITPVYFSDLEQYTNKVFCDPQTFDVELNSSYKPSDRLYSVSVKVDSEESLTNCKLFVWLIEDCISALQSLPDGTRDKDFVHNHVFRDCLTDVAGDDISSGTWSCSYTLPIAFGLAQSYENYFVKPENTHVIAFVVNAEGKVVAATD